MAEAKEAAAPKKSKLPIIVAVVAVVAGGGYFMMKPAEKKPKKVATELGHVVELTDNILINLNGGGYLSCKIALHCAKEKEKYVASAGDGHGGGGGPFPYVKDTIINVLAKHSLDSLSTVEGKAKVRREIAYYLNDASHHFAHVEGEEEAEDSGHDKKKKKGHDDGPPEELAADYEPDHPEWDSDAGPVLKVYFTEFTTQMQ